MAARLPGSKKHKGEWHMTRDVLVRVRGIQIMEEDDDAIEVITPGVYYLKNGKHYVLYDENLEDFDAVTHNTVKITQDKVEVLKRGAAEVHMVFESGKKHVTNYLTPVGPILLGLTTAAIAVEEKENALHIQIDYALELNGEHVSGCRMDMQVLSKQEGALHLS